MAASPEPRINEKIRAREVRVIGPTGEQLGIKPIPQALSLAREMDLDLVEVADKANPPVCRIMDYGKYKYEAAQRAKESRKKASNVVVKEMKYRPKIGQGDFDTKTRKVESFLQEGHKVKITIMFRGREVTHPELGRKILDDIAERVDDYAKIEAYPRLDGRNMTMVLGPDTKKVKARKAQEAREAKEAARAAAGATAPAAEDAVVNGAEAEGAEISSEVSAEAVNSEKVGTEEVHAEAVADDTTDGQRTESPEPVAADSAGTE